MYPESPVSSWHSSKCTFWPLAREGMPSDKKKKNVKAHFLSQIPSCSPLIQLPSPAIVLPPSFLVFGVAQRRTEFRKQEVRDEFCRGHSLFERRCRPLFVILIVIRRGGGRDKFQGLCQGQADWPLGTAERDGYARSLTRGHTDYSRECNTKGVQSQRSAILKERPFCHYFNSTTNVTGGRPILKELVKIRFEKLQNIERIMQTSNHIRMRG